MTYNFKKNETISSKLSKIRWQTKPYKTQKELATILHTNQTEISRIENGSLPQLNTLIMYCRYYKISIDELLEIPEPKNKINYI